MTFLSFHNGNVTVECVRCLVNQLPPGRRGCTFSYWADDIGKYVWDIDKAEALVKDGRPSFPLPDAMVLHAVASNEIGPEHVRHVDPTTPGIIAQAFDAKLRAPGMVLIDGNHRAARCLIEGKIFYAYILNDEESNRCLRHKPELLPWQEQMMAAMSSLREGP